MKARVIRDDTYADMWRVQWPDGRLSDRANLTRTNDAAASFNETTERRERKQRKPAT